MSSKPPPFVRVPEIEVRYAPDYKTVYVSGAFGTIDLNEGRIMLFVDKLDPKIKDGGQVGEMQASRIVREFLIDLRMSPETYKGIAKWMSDNVGGLGT